MDELSKNVDTQSTAEYNGICILSGGEVMTVANIIRDALAAKGMPQSRLAERMKWSPQNLSNRLKNNAFTAEEWRKVADFIGYEVKMVEPGTNEELKTRKRGLGRRVKQMVNGIYYDTEKSDALCNNFYQDGTNEYTDGWAQELYRDSSGRFFVAHYTGWKGGVDHISPIESEDARILYEKYGDAEDAESIFCPHQGG